MTEYLVNPRRAFRATSRCAVQVQAPVVAWRTETEDVSGHGCQLVAPRALARGLSLTLVLDCPGVPVSLEVDGTVAWGSSQPPWRTGVAFSESSRGQAERWFAQVAAAHPRLTGVRSVPERLSVEAMIFLAPPPTFLLDFNADEVEVLRHVAGGTTLASLRSRLLAGWNGAQRAIFSLLARGAVTTSRGASAHPSAWKVVMADLGVDFVAEGQRPVGPTPFVERPSPRAPPATTTAPPPLATPPPAQAPVQRAASPTAWPPPAVAGPGATTAGTGWRGEVHLRTPEAQECLDLGRAELAAGRTQSAMAHLRRALQLAPGDAEIAAQIGRAMSSR